MQCQSGDANLSGTQSHRLGKYPTRVLSQAQLDEARAYPANPPGFDSVLDAIAGVELTWRGRSPDERTQPRDYVRRTVRSEILPMTQAL